MVGLVAIVAMDWEWLKEFGKGMIKPLLALAVVIMAMVLSYLQKLGLEGEMIYSIFRSFVQLSIIGFVLQFIFSQKTSVWIVVAYLFMVCTSDYHNSRSFLFSDYIWKFARKQKKWGKPNLSLPFSCLTQSVIKINICSNLSFSFLLSHFPFPCFFNCFCFFETH